MDEHKEQERLRIKRQVTTAGIVIISACCIILFYFGVERYQGLGEMWGKILKVGSSIFIGFALAFLMNPIMKFLEKNTKKIFQKLCKTEEKAKKTGRMVCSLIALLVVVGIIVMVFTFVIPELYTTVRFLVTHLSEQIDAVLDWANVITGGRFEKEIMGAKGSDINKAINDGLGWVEENIEIGTKDMVSVIANSVIGIGRLFFDMIIGMIISVYILCSKETFKGQAKKILYGFFKTEVANNVMEIYRKAADIFYGFLIGKLMDSIIIGIICYIGMLIFKMPYPLLCSVIIGVTNIIPVFGPYIGAVPTVIIIFLTEPKMGIYFLIYVLVLQQVDGNIIGPKILGDSTGLSAFWVVVAIVVGGGLFGLPGMLFGVPTMALLYYLIGRLTEKMLHSRNLPEATEEYVNLERIDENTNQIILHPEDYHEKKHANPFLKKEEKNKKKAKE